MEITYFLRDDGACGYYRCTLPLKTIAENNKDIKVNKVEKGDGAAQIEKQLNADLFIIPRPSELQIVNLMKELQKLGKKIVVDIDDNLFKISPLSPHYQEFGTTNVKYQFPDGKVDLWKHGENIDLQVNRDRLEVLSLGLERADMITVTTEILADYYRQFNDNVKVLPNCIDGRIWKKLPLRKPVDEIRIGWQGGSSHFEDICLLKDVLPEIIFKYPQVKLVFMGSMFKSVFKTIPKNRLEHHNWVPTPAYPYKTAILDYDIGLIPLQGTDFDRCKSVIKWIEFSSLAVPTVTSYVLPYTEVAQVSPSECDDNGYFIENNDPNSWVKAISLLIENKLARTGLGSNAREYVNKHFDINTQYHRWIDSYQDLLC